MVSTACSSTASSRFVLSLRRRPRTCRNESIVSALSTMPPGGGACGRAELYMARWPAACAPRGASVADASEPARCCRKRKQSL